MLFGDSDLFIFSTAEIANFFSPPLVDKKNPKKTPCLRKQKDRQQAQKEDFLQSFLILLCYFSAENGNFPHPELTEPFPSRGKALQGCYKKKSCDKSSSGENLSQRE